MRSFGLETGLQFNVARDTLLAGRRIDAGDIAGSTPVAVINRVAAERYFSRAGTRDGGSAEEQTRRPAPRR